MFSHAKPEVQEGRRQKVAWHSTALLARQALLLHSFLLDLVFPTHLTRSTKTSALTPGSSGRSWGGESREAQPSPLHSPLSSLPLAFWGILAPDPANFFKKKKQNTQPLHPFQALQATAGQDQLTMSSLG